MTGFFVCVYTAGMMRVLGRDQKDLSLPKMASIILTDPFYEFKCLCFLGTKALEYFKYSFNMN